MVFVKRKVYFENSMDIVLITRRINIKKRIIIIVAVVLSVCVVLFAGYNLFYSYPFIKTYNVEISEDTLNLKFDLELYGKVKITKKALMLTFMCIKRKRLYGCITSRKG